ncbi:MAG: maltokinase N-terminal cap-like domain-containing protein [Terriglobales bacterium]
MAPVRESDLAAWLPRQRWYGAKNVRIESVRVVEHRDVLALVEVVPAGQGPQVYAVPELAGEGLGSEAVRQRWWELLRQQQTAGKFRFETLGALGAIGGSRLLGAEQSNTSVLYSDLAGAPRWILKLFRRVQEGENPDFEIPRALLRHTKFGNVPAAAGRLLYGGAATLAVAQEFVSNQGDGWDYVLGRLRAGAGAALLPEMEQLGRRTAELHTALASIAGEADFAPEAITEEDVERWRQRALAGANAAAAEDQALIEPWRQRIESGPAGLDGLLGCQKIRIHGDYHLGQTLKTAGDFYLLDFEGEPARPLAERRRKGTVLQDVAGMLRSLGYVAHTADQGSWEAPAREAFLAGYRAVIETAPVSLVARGAAAFTAACSFFECEKAAYELAYERNHRPDWVRLPIAALRHLLA